MTFKELGLSELVLKGVEEKGYETPSDIQEKAIPILLEGHDLLAQSQTGTGKTAAFGLPMIDALEGNAKNVRGLVLAPTRELCMQVANELRSFGKYKNLNIVSVYGGEHIDKQMRELRRGVDIVVATPGRLMDHLRRKTIRLDECTRVVLDEADEMLNMGFVDDINEIFTSLPAERQMVFFSATMPKEIIKLSNQYLVDPKKIALSNNNLTVSKIEQVFYSVENNAKVNLVTQLLQIHKTDGTMIFCNTKRMVDELTTELNKAGYPALGLHGDMKQEMRTMVMNRFKKGMVSVLIATDVAARGIDVDNMDVVINYDIPQELEYYVHRIGRTGRAGKSGLAITLASRRQKHVMRQIERLSNSEIKELPMPSKEQLNELMVEQMALDIRKWADAKQSKLFTIAYEGLTAKGFSQEEIIVAYINKSIADNNLEAIKGNGAKESAPNAPISRISISMGNKHGVSPAHLVSAVASATGISGNAIGKIVVGENSSTVEVPREHLVSIVDKLSDITIKDRKITVEVVEEFATSAPRHRDRGPRKPYQGGGSRAGGSGSRSRDRAPRSADRGSRGGSDRRDRSSSPRRETNRNS